MEKSTFVEVFLTKYGQMTQPDAEKLVKRFIELFQNRKNPDKPIDGMLGYIKDSQRQKMSNEDIADYVHGDLLNCVTERESGNMNYEPSTQSYWVEMSNPAFPKL